MAEQTRSIAVHQVFLDNENPRHNPIDNEAEIIAQLLSAERIKPLASDIAKFGLSPLERMAVVEHPSQRSKFIAVEGNRRLCVIKLLVDPERAPAEPVRRLFRDLKKSSPHSFKNIDAVVFESREDARHWLTLRHEGTLDGAGTRPWDTSQKTRFNRTQGAGDNPNVLSQLILDYALHRKLISDEQFDSVNLTTLTRFLSNPVFRDALGLASNKAIAINAPQEEFDRALKKFLVDSITPKSKVHSRTTAKDRTDYAADLRSQGISPKTRISEPIELNAATGATVSVKASTKKKARDNRSPDHRSSVIPSDFTCQIKDKIHKRIYDELKSIDHATYSFSAAYLLRAMIEMSTRGYCKKHKISTNAELHILIGKAADHLQVAGVPPKELKTLRVMASNRDVGYSPESLGASIHGGSVPQKVELARYWDSMETGIRHLLEGSA